MPNNLPPLRPSWPENIINVWVPNRRWNRLIRIIGGTIALLMISKGDGNPVNFVIFDGYSNVPTLIPSWYGDNSGSLTVDIFAQL